MKLAELKNVIKSDLIIYNSTTKVTYNNVDVMGRIFTDYLECEVIGVRAITRYIAHTRKNVAFIVVSIRQ